MSGSLPKATCCAASRSEQNAGRAEASRFRRIHGWPPNTRDRTIRAQLLAELQEQKWVDTSEGRIVVTDSIVHLWGVVGSADERRALRIAAENTPGVRGIEDHTEFAPVQPYM